jgi:hypothetical protein
MMADHEYEDSFGSGSIDKRVRKTTEQVNPKATASGLADFRMSAEECGNSLELAQESLGQNVAGLSLIKPRS